MNNKIANYIGLAMRAGKISSGDFAVQNAIKKKEAKLIFIAEDAATNTKKDYIAMAELNNIPAICKYSKEELGRIIGKEFRATLAVTDQGFTNAILKIMADDTRER